MENEKREPSKKIIPSRKAKRIKNICSIKILNESMLPLVTEEVDAMVNYIKGNLKRSGK